MTSVGKNVKSRLKAGFVRIDRLGRYRASEGGSEGKLDKLHNEELHECQSSTDI